MLKITIPSPCHQDWNTMLPNEQGRHCTSCVKTVVDFTKMSDDEVKYFFINKKEEKICGRFRNEQLHRITIALPHNIFYIAMPLWKKFLVASLIVFSTTLFSCDTVVKDKIEPGNATKDLVLGGAMEDLTPIKDTVKSISPIVTLGALKMTIVESVTQGGAEMIPMPPDEIPATPTAEMGEIQLTPADSIKTTNPPKADSLHCVTQIFS